MLFTFIQLIFIVLLVRQIVIVAIAMWTGTQSDIPFQSTKKSVLKKLINYLNITAEQTIYDLGSGSGQVTFFLAQNSPARIIGVEKNYPLYCISRIKQFLRPQSRLKFFHQDLFDINLSKADIIYTYFSPRAYKKAQAKFERELQSGVIFIAWRYPFNSPQFKLIHQIEDWHTMYIYRKQR